jgi:5-methylcytosine-specific restriction endonuclease McrA
MSNTKTCKTCGEVKPLDGTHFIPHRFSFRATCRECNERKLNPGGMRICTVCKQEKSVDDFYRNARQTLSGSCKQCLIEYQHRHHHANKAAILEKQKAYAAANQEKISAYKKEWSQKNRARRLSTQRAYFAKNREKITQQISDWHKAQPPEKKKATSVKRHSNRRAAKLNAKGSFTLVDLQAKREMCGDRCYYCQTRLANLPVKRVHVDHKIPLSRGGSNWPANLTYSCGSCNQSKGARTIKEFIAYKQELGR